MVGEQRDAADPDRACQVDLPYGTFHPVAIRADPGPHPARCSSRGQRRVDPAMKLLVVAGVRHRHGDVDDALGQPGGPILELPACRGAPIGEHRRGHHKVGPACGYVAVDAAHQIGDVVAAEPFPILG